jgi:HlyD family secretion protein
MAMFQTVTTSPARRTRRHLRGVVSRLLPLTLVLAALAACRHGDPTLLQGYVEGRYLYIASPQAGTITALHVARGEQVVTGQPLFDLDHATESNEVDEAARRLDQSRALLADAGKGRRSTELDALEASLRQAEAALEFSTRDLTRTEALLPTQAVSQEDSDRRRMTKLQDEQHVAELRADLATARLGARPDQLLAAQHDVAALSATLAKARWTLAQTTPSAPQDCLVFDVLFRQGEWVSSGRPVVVLLPAENLIVRCFIPEPMLSGRHTGDSAQVRMDGRAEELVGHISFISPQAEYSPPVIYSRDSRAKLLFLVEVSFAPAIARTLHPGQPVDVHF